MASIVLVKFGVSEIEQIFSISSLACLIARLIDGRKNSVLIALKGAALKGPSNCTSKMFIITNYFKSLAVVSTLSFKPSL